jgi:hypothetical protein
MIVLGFIRADVEFVCLSVDINFFLLSIITLDLSFDDVGLKFISNIKKDNNKMFIYLFKFVVTDTDPCVVKVLLDVCLNGIRPFDKLDFDVDCFYRLE